MNVLRRKHGVNLFIFITLIERIKIYIDLRFVYSNPGAHSLTLNEAVVM